MSKKEPICYKKARMLTPLTQEQAAEQLSLSLESVKAYERGDRLPPGPVVARMAQLYGAPWLKLEHLRLLGDGLQVLPEGIRTQPLSEAVLQLVNRVFEFADRRRDRQLMRIAEDGVVDEGERQEFDLIAGDLDGLICAAYQVLYPAEQTKKVLPGVPAPRRRVPGLASQNKSKIIIAQSVENASPNSAGEEVSSA